MIILEKHKKMEIGTVVFDFDGTISTLRCGWERVMGPLMTEYISGGNPTKEIEEMVKDYIDRSTGIQTIAQMKWLAQTVEQFGMNPSAPSDPWFYKEEYNRRLMAEVAKRRDEAANGAREKYLIAGSEEFLKKLRERGIRMLAASGTDECDVKKESAALGIDRYFEEIAGAKPLSEDCSKQATLQRLMTEGANGKGILVIGDGPVEIKLGREFKAPTLGIASDETQLRGYNEAKKTRLTAGAHALVDCFEDTDRLITWMEDGCNE